MKILLDECIDKRLARAFSWYEVKTVPQMGWGGVRNGELLALAAASFDVFMTVDRNLSSRQNLSDFDLAVLILHAPSNRLADLEPLVLKIILLLPKLIKGQAAVVS